VSASPWWAGVADAVAEIDCGGERHALRWHHGALLLEDHPAEEAPAEAALEALGAPPPACRALHARWERVESSVEVISLWRRPGEDLAGFEPAGVRPLIAAGSRARAPAAERRRADLLATLSLPPPMIDRLVLGALAAASARWPDEAFRARHGLRLGAALAARARPAVTRLGEELAGPGRASVTVAPAPPGTPPAVTARLAGRDRVVVDAFLDLAWMGEVWARGISEIDGRVVLAVRSLEAPGSLASSTCAPEAVSTGDTFAVDLGAWTDDGAGRWRCVPEPATIVREPEGGWRLGS